MIIPSGNLKIKIDPVWQHSDLDATESEVFRDLKNLTDDPAVNVITNVGYKKGKRKE